MSSENVLIEVQLAAFGSTIKCLFSHEEGKFVRNGYIETGAQALKCLFCRTQVSGKNVYEMIEAQRGTDWNLEAVKLHRQSVTLVQIDECGAQPKKGGCRAGNPVRISR